MFHVQKATTSYAGAKDGRLTSRQSRDWTAFYQRHMSLKTFQTAQQIILSFNRVTKSHGKFQRRFKWLNCTNIYLQSETESTVILWLRKFQPKIKVIKYTQSTCKMLHSVSKKLRVIPRVFLRVFFYMRVSRLYFSCNLHAIQRIYTQSWQN